MKTVNNVYNKNKNNFSKDFHQIIVSKLFILALPIIIATPVIPFIIIYLPPKISHIFTALLAIYCSLILLILTISLFFSSNITTRLVGIPISFIITLFGFIIYKLKIYLLLLNAFSLGEPFMITSQRIDETMNLLIPLTMIGVWVSILPIIIYFLRLFFKLTKKKNLSNTINGTGYIKSVGDTHTRINKYRVYHIVLEVQPETGQNFIAEKDFIIPNHIIHTISLGSTVDVLIDCNNNQNIYINTQYGLL